MVAAIDTLFFHCVFSSSGNLLYLSCTQNFAHPPFELLGFHLSSCTVEVKKANDKVYGHGTFVINVSADNPRIAWNSLHDYHCKLQGWNGILIAQLFDLHFLLW